MVVEVSEDEIIGVWLKREFKWNWEGFLKPKYLPRMSREDEEKIKEIVYNPNYENHEENKLRLKLLWSFRFPLLLPLLNASWCEQILSEKEFKELRVIKASGWDLLSNFTGKLAIVARRVYEEERGIWHLNRDVGALVEAIFNLERSVRDLDKKLILLQSDDSKFITILEGNKTAVALYINCYLKNELKYKPFKAFLGRLENKSIWQW